MGMVRDDALLAFERHATRRSGRATICFRFLRWAFAARRCRRSRRFHGLSCRHAWRRSRRGTHSRLSVGRFIAWKTWGCLRELRLRCGIFSLILRRGANFFSAESTELSHVTALVTHYALAHPDKHFELHSASHALLVAPPVGKASERIFQIFGKDTLDQLFPAAAERRLHRAGPPEPPPWKRDGLCAARTPAFCG